MKLFLVTIGHYDNPIGVYDSYDAAVAAAKEEAKKREIFIDCDPGSIRFNVLEIKLNEVIQPFEM